MVPRKFDPREVINFNGDDFVRINSMAELEGLMLDNFHIIIHRKDIEIQGRKCFLCGEDFKGKVKELTKHHAIPKELESKYNVHIPLCGPCHTKFHKYIRDEL